MLPVELILFANILSAAVAIQYAPDAPVSLMTAIFVLLTSLMAVVISSVATGVPPGLLISSSIALMSLFLSACSISLTISALFTPGVNVESSVLIIPDICITATFPRPIVGANELMKLYIIIEKMRRSIMLIPMLIIFQVALIISPPVTVLRSSFFCMVLSVVFLFIYVVVLEEIWYYSLCVFFVGNPSVAELVE